MHQHNHTEATQATAWPWDGASLSRELDPEYRALMRDTDERTPMKAAMDAACREALRDLRREALQEAA